jgi:2-C-methyl-D-erythritol 4-phosphate cytidylyltransferase
VVSEIDGFLAMEVAHQILDKINKSTSVLRQAPVEGEFENIKITRPLDLAIAEYILAKRFA